jgi:hypothetical protein
VRPLRSFIPKWHPLPRQELEHPTQQTAVQEVENAYRQRHVSARQHLADVFTPTRPLMGRTIFMESSQGDELFIGRETERERIMRAFLEDRSHVVIYGERGRGKTSLANLVVAQARSAGFDIARYVCSADSNFDGIMRGLFHEVPRRLSGLVPAGLEDGRGVAYLLPSHALRPGDILRAYDSPRESKIIFVIDEFDRMMDQDTRTAIADTIKQCSDRDLPLLFMIIGVSDSLEELLGRHQSIQRCVIGIPLPLLTQPMVEQIVERGAERAGLDFPASARACIAELARGVPYVAQLLSLRAGQAALGCGRTTVRGRDLISAIKATVVEADPRILILYDAITNAERDAAALSVLRAAAMGVQDELGRFSVVLDDPFLRIAGVRADPAAWRRVLDFGAIRMVRGAGHNLYTFCDPMLPQLVLLRVVLPHKTPALTGSDGPNPA